MLSHNMRVFVLYFEDHISSLPLVCHTCSTAAEWSVWFNETHLRYQLGKRPPAPTACREI